MGSVRGGKDRVSSSSSFKGPVVELQEGGRKEGWKLSFNDSKRGVSVCLGGSEGVAVRVGESSVADLGDVKGVFC